jgi:hypothetical protein
VSLRTASPALFRGCFGSRAARSGGGFRMPSIIIAFTGPCSPIQAFLYGGLTQALVLGVDDGLVADKGEIGLAAGERENAGLAGEHLATQREI